MNAKAALRREARERLGRISPAERASAGREICSRLWALPEMAAADRILLYAALPTEVPTDAIAAAAGERGISVTYPRCEPDTPDMTLHHVTGPSDLRPDGRFGIREPAQNCRQVTLHEVDVVLLPGLGWDREGGRLGKGAGFYDRLLADEGWRGFRCGLFFAAQEFEALPADPWDVPLDAVVTESGVWRPRRAASS